MTNNHTPRITPVVTHSCPSCGSGVRCDIERGLGRCWCFDERPQERAADFGGQCLCKSCLTGRKPEETV